MIYRTYLVASKHTTLKQFLTDFMRLLMKDTVVLSIPRKNTWVPETLLARFSVFVKSLWWRARKASPLVASTFGQHRRFPQNLVTSRVREEWHHVWNYLRCSWGESLVYRLRNSFVDFSTTEGNNIIKLLAISHYWQKIVCTIKMGNER